MAPLNGDLLLMIEILHHLVYVDMYCATRNPMVLLYTVYIRSCRISVIHSRVPLKGNEMTCGLMSLSKGSLPRPIRPNRPQ